MPVYPADYEAETWENASRQESGSYKGSDYGSVRDQKRPPSRSPLPPPSFGGSQYGGGSQSGDYYRDSNALKHHNSNQNLRMSNGRGLGSRMPSMASANGLSGMGSNGPVYGGPPSMPQMGFTPSIHASEYSQGPLFPPQFPGMGQQRNTMMSFPSSYGGGPGSNFGGGGGGGLGGGMQNPRMSTFSLATTANPFAAAPPSQSTDPTDEEVLAELRHYLSSQVSFAFLLSAPSPFDPWATDTY